MARGWRRMLAENQEVFVQRFEDKKVKYFFKVTKRSHVTAVIEPGPFAYQMEFPSTFLENHAHEFSEHTTFESKTLHPDSTKIWPIQITVRHFEASGNTRVFAYGDGGWKAFVTENEVQIGYRLVFQLIGFAKFRVYIFQAWRA